MIAVSPVLLVLRLQVDSPLDRKFEFLVRPLEHSDRLAIIHMHEFRADDPLEFLRPAPFLDMLAGPGVLWSDGAAIA